MIKEFHLDSIVLKALASVVEDKTYKPGEFVLKEGEDAEAAFYIISKGEVELTSNEGRKEMLNMYCHFGDETMLLDAKAGSSEESDPTTTEAPYTVRNTGKEDCLVGLARLKDCRRIFDTRYLGKPKPSARDSIIDRHMALGDFERHRIIGCGKATFLGDGGWPDSALTREVRTFFFDTLS